MEQRKNRGNIRLKIHKTLVSELANYMGGLSRRYLNIIKKVSLVLSSLSKRAQYAVIALAVFLPTFSTFALDFMRRGYYDMSDRERTLVSASTVRSEMIENTREAILYNRASDYRSDPQKKLSLGSSSIDSSNPNKYKSVIFKDLKKGIYFSDISGEREVVIKPKFGLNEAQLVESRVLFPVNSSEKHYYTFRESGIKSDIVLTEKPIATDSKKYSYTIDLGDELDAKLLSDGRIGVYSADPVFYDNLQASDQKSVDVINNARKNGDKNHLVYEIPAPFIKNANGLTNYDNTWFDLEVKSNGDGSKTALVDLNVSNLRNQIFPISIDPSFTVSGTSLDVGADVGTYSNTDTTASSTSVSRSDRTNAYPSNWQTQASSLPGNRHGHATAISGQYAYVIGGCTFGTTNCGDANIVDDVIVLKLSDSGGLLDADPNTGGTQYYWQPAEFTIMNTASYPRYGSCAVAYDNYLYIIGGTSVVSGAASASVFRVQLDPANGGLVSGTWTIASSLIQSRTEMGCAVYNGYIYVVGGQNGTDATFYNTSEYVQIGPNGNLGSWMSTGVNMPTAEYPTCVAAYSGRARLGVVASNNRLYVVGGYTALGGGFTFADTLVANINVNGGIDPYISVSPYVTSDNSAGIQGHALAVYKNSLISIGGNQKNCTTGVVTALNYSAVAYFGSNTETTTWSTGEPYPGTERFRLTSVVYGDYVYAIGGCWATTCLPNVTYAKLGGPPAAGHYNGTDNSIGTTDWSLTGGSFDFPGRQYHSTVVYQGVIYLLGGEIYDGSVPGYCMLVDGVSCSYDNGGRYGIINGRGSISWSATTFSIPAARRSMCGFAYNGYIYMLGGSGTTSDDATPTGGNTYRYAALPEVPESAAAVPSSWSGATVAVNLPSLFGASCEIYNNRIYVTGGRTGASTYLDTVYVATFNTNGTLSTFTQLNSFTTARSNHSTAIYNGYLYIMGGRDSGYLNTTYFAKINNDGTLGNWAQSTSIITARSEHLSKAYDGFLYYHGGRNAGYTTDTRYARICDGVTLLDGCESGTPGVPKSIGDIGTWNLSNLVGDDRYATSDALYNGFWYVTGGRRSIGNASTGNSWYVKLGQHDIRVDTARPGAHTNFARAYHQSVAYGDYIYVLGGTTSSSTTACKNSGTSAYCNDVISSTVDRLGRMGNQIYSTGTASQTGTTVTGTGTTWTSGMVGGVIYYYLNGETATITGFTSATSLTVSTSQTVTGTAYAIYSPNWKSTTANSSGSGYFTNPRSNFGAVAYNGYIYIFGGTDGTNTYNDVQYALICTYQNSGQGGCNGVPGTVGTWRYTHNSASSASFVSGFTTARRNHQVVQYNGYVYVIGGANSSGTTLSDIQYAQINNDGTIGAWSSTTSLPQARQYHTAAAYNGSLYVIDGSTTDPTTIGNATVPTNPSIRVVINGDATLGSEWFTNYRTAYPGRMGSTAIAVNDGIYVVGGIIASGTRVLPNMSSARINNDGTILTSDDWTARSLLTSRYGHSMVYSNGFMFVIGGCANTDTDGTEPYINANGLACTSYVNASVNTTPNPDHYNVEYFGLFTGDLRGSYSKILTDSNYRYVTGFKITGATSCGYDVTYDASMVNTYSTGTVGTGGASIVTITGTGTTWSSSMVGGTITFSGGTTRTIKTFATATSITVDTAVAVTNGTTYTITWDSFEYTTGTASQSTNTITGVGTTWNARMVGGTVIFSGGQTATITSFNSTTSLTVNVSQTVSSTSYRIIAPKTLKGIKAGVQYNVPTEYTKHTKFLVSFDDSTCGTTSSVSEITVYYNLPPSAPELRYPENNSTNVSVLPQFELGSSDDDLDYLRYKIEVCSTSNCSVIVRTIDQTSSQIGWASQSQESATAYSSAAAPTIAQYAIHNYQAAALSYSSTYYWRASAIDPGGSGQWSSASSINTFQTGPAPTTTNQQVMIKGGTSIGGQVNIKP